jgi:hypothetical protein
MSDKEMCPRSAAKISFVIWGKSLRQTHGGMKSKRVTFCLSIILEFVVEEKETLLYIFINMYGL